MVKRRSLPIKSSGEFLTPVQRGHISSEEYLELFLVTLLALNYRKNAESSIRATPSTEDVTQARREEVDQVAENKEISILSCGWTHTIVFRVRFHFPLTAQKDKETFSWGKNSYGQLGLGSIDNISVPTPIPVLKNKVITHVACGGDHTIFVEGKCEEFA